MLRPPVSTSPLIDRARPAPAGYDAGVRGVPVPQREEDFAADAGELFFDLVFVFAFSQLVSRLVSHPTWAGAAEFWLLFTMVWLPWAQFTWSANAVAGNSRPVRLLFLVATVASIPMAASVMGAFGAGGAAFALSASVILAMGLFTMISGLGDEPVVRASIVRYSIPNWIAIALMAAGGFLPFEPRVILWSAAMVTVLVGTIGAGQSEWLVRPGHFAERHGLIVIVALGEVIVALGLPLTTAQAADEGVAPASLVALVAAGAFAGLLWWGYFDRPLPALEHRHETLEGGHLRGRFARDVYTYAHYPLVAGVILCTAGLKTITVNPGERIPLPSLIHLGAGLVLYLSGVVLAVVRAFGSLAVERLAAALLLVAVIAAASRLDGVLVLLAVDGVLLAMLVVEHHRVERLARTVPMNRVMRART